MTKINLLKTFLQRFLSLYLPIKKKIEQYEIN